MDKGFLDNKTAVLSYRGGIISAGKDDSIGIAEGVSFDIGEGESFALIGETGSGKTMTALSVMGLLPPGVRQMGEEVLFMDKTLPKGKAMKELLGSEIVYIPQNGAESLDPLRTVKKQMYDGLKKLGTKKEMLSSEASSKLVLSGFEDPAEILDKYPFQLSGGMCQRVTIAIAACSNAKLIIADEPSNGLDDDFAEDFIALVRRIFPKAAVLMITHDISIASKCESLAVLCGGRMMEKGSSSEVLKDPRSPYTGSLLAALPENGMKATPILREESSSCPFYSRCPEATERCTISFPWQGDEDRGWRCVL